MKKILYLLVLFPILVIGQTQSENYTKVTAYKVETTDPIHDPVETDATIQVTYYDGLGRPIQKIANKQSNTSKDIITHIEYDAFGRQAKEYLPYVSENGSLQFDPDGKPHTLNYTDAISGGLLPTDYNGQNPYSQKFFEASPLNRVLKQSAPGLSWLGNDNNDNDHTIKFNFQTNRNGEVKRFKANAEWEAGVKLYSINLVDDGFYDANQLYKTVTKDENWTSGVNNTTEEFKDKEGRVLLKRTYNNEEVHDTYYVYDKYGNLTYVIPPKVNINNTIGDDILKDLCYQYRYDYRNRLVEKKLPGKQWEYIVYDKLDRVVATGPTFSPFGGSKTGWLITKYDVFGRVAYTAWMSNDQFTSEQRNNFQNQINGNTVLFENRANTTIDNILCGYTNDITPVEDLKLLTINYYDDYKFPNAPSSIQSQVLGKDVLANTKGMPTGSWVRVLTAPDETFADLSYMLYDKKGRTTKVYTTNYLGGFTYVENKYNFAGQVLQTFTKHQKSDGTEPVRVTEDFQYTAQGRLLNHFHQINDRPKELMTHNTYDELGKLISKNVGGTNTDTCEGLQKVDYGYNIRGWLKNINNVNNLNGVNAPTDLFAFKINYDDDVTETVDDKVKPLYNGNISETYWRTASDNTIRKYGYQYDNLNRLLGSFYQKPQAPVQVTNSYNERIGYDKNGNIEHLFRTGALDDQYETITIDNLEYNYPDNSNQLVKVKDYSNDPQGFKDDTDTDPDDNSNDYSYDDNGNMTRDDNKGIGVIKYNHLNLPTQIDFGTNGRILYLYDATGKKVKKTVETNDDQIPTHYLDGFQYKADELQFFPTAEGYVNISHTKFENGLFEHEVETMENQYSYVYNYVDHLGNIRLSYGKDPSNGVLRIIEENHYYPFGLKHTNYNSDKMIYVKEDEMLKIKLSPNNMKTSYNYKYNGKEYQDELGLNMYDYGSRLYDPARAGWSNIDPLAEKMRRYSPYNYCFDNPLRFTDPDGMKPQDIIIRGSASYQNRVLGDMQKLTNDKLVLVDGQVKIASTGTENKGRALPTGSGVIASLIESPKTTEIRSTSGQNTTTPKDIKADGTSNANGTVENPGKGADSTIEYNPNSKGENIVNDDETCSTGRPAEIGIGHELPHALNNANGTADQTKNPDTVDPDSGQKGVLTNEEINVRKVDNEIRIEQGVTPRPIPQ